MRTKELSSGTQLPWRSHKVRTDKKDKTSLDIMVAFWGYDSNFVLEGRNYTHITIWCVYDSRAEKKGKKESKKTNKNEMCFSNLAKGISQHLSDIQLAKTEVLVDSSRWLFFSQHWLWTFADWSNRRIPRTELCPKVAQERGEKLSLCDTCQIVLSVWEHLLPLWVGFFFFRTTWAGTARQWWSPRWAPRRTTTKKRCPRYVTLTARSGSSTTLLWMKTRTRVSYANCARRSRRCANSWTWLRYVIPSGDSWHRPCVLGDFPIS